ncbi:PQQ-like beta-propeller repeat protein [Phenylobacterium sp.]|mgnify:CR=1 FL=1|jgi:outer membrane protein assembly factor BamB|uniref:PQQ-like beta-propeller repeat protein n=1 Tax=Phenylobacterium sp. TaxID=1871053 RepID=UPI000C9357F6|nr:PQQ-like beta-propeller repeat protein [Phenylobacterium sp.]MAK81705.1 dehydrogenase [Phenylobacterium sp.]|tara:strand:- start:2018 stop:3403 length:1386 start_codon:yes stop_codon:yes gene_type:complete
MILSRPSMVAVLLASAVAISGCSTVNRLNPFDRDEGPQEIAGEGERISVIAFNDTIEPSETLSGADFFLPTPYARAAWPLPGGVPEQASEHVEAAVSFDIAWRRNIGEGSGRGHHVTAPPVAADGKLYVMDGSAQVSAIDLKSGRTVWSADLQPPRRDEREGFGGGVAYAGGKLYVTSGYRFVARLDAATGAVEWRRETEQPIHAAPTVTAGRVMAVAIDNTLLTFDTATGAPSWTYQALSEPARILGASTPAVSGDTVVAAFSSGELVALRSGNGNDLWNEGLSRGSRTNALSEIRDIAGRPAIYRGDVYAVSHAGAFAAIDLRTGAPRWTLPVTSTTTPWPAGDVVYVVSKAGEVICVSRESGQVYWIRDLNEGVTPKKVGGVLGIGGRPGAKPLWTGPLLASNKLIVASSTGELAVLDPKTGAVERTMKLGAAVLLEPIAVDGMVYVVTDDAQVIALS